MEHGRDKEAEWAYKCEGRPPKSRGEAHSGLGREPNDKLSA